MTTPPQPGDQNWGAALDAYLQNVLLAQESQTATAFSAHIVDAPINAGPTDPHGDRAYALGLLAPILSGANGPNGFLQLDSNGIPPGGQWTSLGSAFLPFGPPPGTLYPPQYRKTLDGEVRLAGNLSLAASGTYNGVSVFSIPLPAGFIPAHQVPLPVTISSGGTGILIINIDGTMEFDLPGSLALDTTIGIYGSYPLDNYYGLLQG